jgi:hypothetical protein
VRLTCICISLLGPDNLVTCLRFEGGEEVGEHVERSDARPVAPFRQDFAEERQHWQDDRVVGAGVVVAEGVENSVIGSVGCLPTFTRCEGSK